MNMVENDIIEDNGTESFICWLEDGAVFANNGHGEDEVAQLMEYAREVALDIDDFTWAVAQALEKAEEEDAR